MGGSLCCAGDLAAVEDARWLLDRGDHAQDIDGDLQASRRWFEAAYREGERIADAEVMAKAVLGLGGLWVHERRATVDSALWHARLRHAFTLVEPSSDLALRLWMRLTVEEDYRSGRHATTLTLLDMVRTSSDPAAGGEALSLAHQCLLGPQHRGMRRALAEELVTRAATGERRRDVLMGLLWQVVNLLLDGDRHAERRLGELRAALAEGEHLAIRYVVSAIEVMLAIRRGHFDDAERQAQACFEQGTKAGDIHADAWYAGQLVMIRWYQDRLPELLPMLNDLAQSHTLSAVDNAPLAALAVAAAKAGDQRTAETALAKLRGRSLADLPRSSSWLVAMYGIVEAAHLVGNIEASAKAYELLHPYADLPMMAGLAVACFGSVHHALGVASLTTGDIDSAVHHLREAVRHNLALGHWPAVIASRLRYAEALEARGCPGDEGTADEQRRRAMEAASMLDPSVPASTMARHAPARRAICVRHGRRWLIELGDRAIQVDHSVGMTHLAVLIANPGAEIPAIELVAGLDAVSARGARMSAQTVLDRTTIARYRQRLSELEDQIDDLIYSGETEKAADARREREWFLAELAAGTGLSGRLRAFSNDKERARLAASRAIRRALAHIEQADAVIGENLRAGIHTGGYCCYRPL